MYKRMILGKLVLFLVMALIFGFGASCCNAEDEEELTITTTSALPQGVDNELKSKQAAVEDTNDDELISTDQPANPEKILPRPQSIRPETKTADFTSRVAQTGGGCYVSYSGSCLPGFSNMGSAGFWGSCFYFYDYGLAHFRPPGASCSDGWLSYSIGEAYVCCR